MPSTTQITVPQLARLVGLPDAPRLVDVRIDDDFQADPRLLPASYRRDFRTVSTWAADFSGSRVVVICQRGEKLSQGVAAWLRHEGIPAESLEGGFAAWAAAKAPLVAADAIPPRDGKGRTVWVTRSRPKVDRIACPWLIRRFVDPGAVFLFVDPAEVPLVADRFAAVPFDIEGVFWSHRGDHCTFDTMIEEFGLRTEALDRLALIVRGADTARLDLVPQAAGFLAASLGLSRMFRDDLEQLEAGMLLYDAFFRWCRDATDETHNWPAGGKQQ
ncbi:sulfurtransferase [Mesorhizobium sp. M1A.F.Ca.IN.020.06.1.1]|uniref:chromate resistance protein ChrB domain-containing protein n=1 Tax=unclassified Mesorhizobium TaxID=325217 RepID=UPI000BB0A72B|nr:MULTISPECIES: sulfurtransferase/chromate resistance protein [unclassified Mesorhizobium]PBB34101.1 sulfurtransferase [Mesorhizobium sp. WSM3882]RUU96368.1 sulfurtransferase [Mesorhizobium sp. M1A.F.Ca.IN.020.03.2.1]RUV82408.1 sulfurtransferase [Mesorhizobium sp. M1A.F.Ca.IN.020.32.1.1]RUW07007.1 sulfurtransferase [Mesorhizobium sp. M1A.F.Ca.IN.022.05.2.1]RUW19578.1 sulfurtransferase [Mesorhizobium sp. M1A.F.Ca.IN.020.06.1.1]